MTTNPKAPTPPDAPRCPACGDSPLRLVAVHGHGQCARCGCNVEPCCQPDSITQICVSDEPRPVEPPR